MVPFYKRVLSLCLLGLACACTDTPKPEVYPDAEAGQQTQRSTPSSEKPEALALAIGDSIVHSIEGSFLQLAESQAKAQALFVSQPDKLPGVQLMLQRYQARLERRVLSKREQKKRRLAGFLSSGSSVEAKVQETGGELVYERPIQVRRRNCASCEEPSLLNFMAKDVTELRVFSAQGRPEGYEVGAVTGVWVVRFPTEALR